VATCLRSCGRGTPILPLVVDLILAATASGATLSYQPGVNTEPPPTRTRMNAPTERHDVGWCCLPLTNNKGGRRGTWGRPGFEELEGND
jgi:hypothetical protein